MSHFSVLVIGPNVEEQLQPYHEFECTGEDDQYVQDLDITEKARKEYEEFGEGESFADFVASWHGLEKVEPLKWVDIEKVHKYGWVEVDEAGEVVRIIDRTNPNAKWDWWVVGGRWGGFLRTKGGQEVDICAKVDVDWEGIKNEAAIEAGEKWDLAQSVIAGRELTPWKVFLERRDSGELTIEEARDAYNKQEAVVAFQKNRDLMWHHADDFLVSREEYVQAARNASICTFAVVKDGQWYEKGSMGWWGCVSDEKDAGEWQRQFAELIEGLPDETLLTVVDCHI